MTCIAWDGKTLAADKRATVGNTVSITTKIHRINGLLTGGAGNATESAQMREWVRGGRDPEKFPIKEKDVNRFMVIELDGSISVYEHAPVPIRFEEQFFAIGSGRDFALAAMHLGKTSKQAVELACRLDVYCGNGVDTLRASKT